MSDGTGGGTPGGFEALVRHLLGEVEALRAEVNRLKAGQPAPAAATEKVAAARRTLPTEGDPVDMAVLVEWVESLVVRYASTGDWLRPCWQRHGFVVEELAALRVAWLAVFDADEPADASAGVKWHEEAEKCRERIRRTISSGPGCSGASHKPDQPVTADPRWAEERVEVHEPVVIVEVGTDATLPQ